MSAGFTPGPWDYVPSTKHHGPYVVSPWGGAVADFYTMSNPSAASVRNGGTSYPIAHQGELADANARLAAAAPDLYEAGERLAAVADCKLSTVREIIEAVAEMRAAIAKASGEQFPTQETGR